MTSDQVSVEYPDDGHIFVCVRVRNTAALPFLSAEGGGANSPRATKQERRNASRVCVSSIENVVVVHDPKTLDDAPSVARDTNNVVQLLTERANARSNKAAHKVNLLASKLLTPTTTANFYECDACLNSMDEASMMAMPIIKHSDFLRPPAYGSQEDVYQCTAAHAIRAAVDGINSCVFAYGQTGSGKTYTLFGDTECLSRDPGIVPRTLDDLFGQLGALREQHVNDPATEYSYRVQLSFFEIYNNDVFCLLSRKGPLRVSFNRDPNSTRETMVIHSLQTQSVTSAAKAFPLVEVGLRHRQTGETGMNWRSSRSHAILQISVTQWRTNRTTRETVQLNSMINLVDLAGSERQKTARTDGKSREEGIQINQSLATLARVINEISRGAKYVNYRDSLLTMVLKDNLGGNSKTFMIATVSPVALCHQESCATLVYARDVRKIRNRPVVNKSFQTRSNLLELNARLKMENEQLKLHIEQLTEGHPLKRGGSASVPQGTPIPDVAWTPNPRHTLSMVRTPGQQPSDGNAVFGELIWERSALEPQREALLAAQSDGPLAPVLISAQRTYTQSVGVGGSCMEGSVRVNSLVHEAMYIQLNKVAEGIDVSLDLGAIEFECVSQRACDKRYWLRSIPPSASDPTVSVEVRVNGMKLVADRHEMVHGDVVTVFIDRPDSEDAVQRILTFHYVDLMCLSRHNVLGNRQGLEALQFGALRVSVDLPDDRDQLQEPLDGEDLNDRIRMLERENGKLLKMLQSQANTIEYQNQKVRESQVRMNSIMGSRTHSPAKESGRNSPDPSFAYARQDDTHEKGYRYNIPTQRTSVSPSLVRDVSMLALTDENAAKVNETAEARNAMLQDLKRQIEQLRMSCQATSSSSSPEAHPVEAIHSPCPAPVEESLKVSDCSSPQTTGTVRHPSAFAVGCLEGSGEELCLCTGYAADKPPGSSQSRDDALTFTTNNLVYEDGTRGCSSPSISHGGVRTATSSDTFSGALDSVYAARTPHISDVTTSNPLSRHASPPSGDAVGPVPLQQTGFSLPSADEILRRYRAAPEVYHHPGSDGVCERFHSAKRELVLCERIWELEELLDRLRENATLLESKYRVSQDSLLDAEIRIAQLEEALAELAKSLEEVTAENRNLGGELQSLEEFLHKTEEALTSASTLNDEEVGKTLEALMEKQAALRALARMWKRRAMARLAMEGDDGTGTRPRQIPWEQLNAESSAAVAKRLLGKTLCTPTASHTIDEFERESALDSVIALEKLIADLEKNNLQLKSEVQQRRHELAEYMELVDRLRRELREMEETFAARDDGHGNAPSAGAGVAGDYHDDYARKCEELIAAEERLAEITAKLNAATDSCETLLRHSTQSSETLFHEQRRIIDQQNGEQARLSAQLQEKNKELRTALSFLEEQAATVDSGSQKDIAMRERIEKLINDVLQANGQAAPGMYSAFPPDFPFSDELVTLIRICLRVLMDRLKVEMYVLNRHNVHKFSLLVPAISLRPDMQFNSFIHELRGVVTEMAGRMPRIGARWGLTEADILERLVDHRRRRAGDALCGLLIWYDHWDMSPKTEHISYVELIRNAERVLQMARLVRQESKVNTNSSSTQNFLLPTAGGHIEAMYLDDETIEKDKTVMKSKKILEAMSHTMMKSNLARCVARVRTPSGRQTPVTAAERLGNSANDSVAEVLQSVNDSPLCRRLTLDGSETASTTAYHTPSRSWAPPISLSAARVRQSPLLLSSTGGCSAFKEALSSTILSTAEGGDVKDRRETVMPMTETDLTMVGADILARQDSLTTYNRQQSSLTLSARGEKAARRTASGTAASKDGKYRRSHTWASGSTPAAEAQSDHSQLAGVMSSIASSKKDTLAELGELMEQKIQSATATRRAGAAAARHKSVIEKSRHNPCRTSQRLSQLGGNERSASVPPHDDEPPSAIVATSRPGSGIAGSLSRTVSLSTMSASSSRVRGTMGSGTSSLSHLPSTVAHRRNSVRTAAEPSFYDPVVLTSLRIGGSDKDARHPKRSANPSKQKKSSAGPISRSLTATGQPVAAATAAARHPPQLAKPTTDGRQRKSTPTAVARKLSPLRRTVTSAAPTAVARKLSPLRRTVTTTCAPTAPGIPGGVRSPLRQTATPNQGGRLRSTPVKSGGVGASREGLAKTPLKATSSARGFARASTQKKIVSTQEDPVPKIDMVLVRVRGKK